MQRLVDLIYTAVLGGTLLLLVLFRILSIIRTFMFMRCRRFVLRYFLYPVTRKWLANLLPSPLYVLLTISYFAGTIVCNVIRVRSLSDAGVRAGHLSLINLIPMYLSGGYEFGAYLLGVSLETYGAIHRIVGVMAVTQATIHVVIMVRTEVVSTANNSHLYGILVCHNFLPKTATNWSPRQEVYFFLWLFYH